jgi:hypothetical protein
MKLCCDTRNLMHFHERPWRAPFLASLNDSGPVTVAERSKVCTVFASSEAGIVSSSPKQGIDVWYVSVCLFCVCVDLCLGRGLATS